MSYLLQKTYMLIAHKEQSWKKKNKLNAQLTPSQALRLARQIAPCRSTKMRMLIEHKEWGWNKKNKLEKPTIKINWKRNTYTFKTVGIIVYVSWSIFKNHQWCCELRVHASGQHLNKFKNFRQRINKLKLSRSVHVFFFSLFFIFHLFWGSL